MNPPRNRLWAPWRMAYIKIQDKGGCFLCRYSKEKKDKKNLVVRRGKKTLCVINRYPYNNGHLMVAPKRHIAKLEAMTPDEVLEMWDTVARMKKIMDRTMHPNGYNIGINLGRLAGAGLPGHIHLHIVPRWAGDTNYMPVLAKTKVLPMSLEELYKVLTPK